MEIGKINIQGQLRQKVGDIPSQSISQVWWQGPEFKKHFLLSKQKCYQPKQ
jgi:hypothetical protein